MEDFFPVDKIKGDDMEVVSFLILLSNTLQTEETWLPPIDSEILA